MLAGLQLGQQLFDGPLYLRELLYERRTIHHRVITQYRLAGKGGSCKNRYGACRIDGCSSPAKR